MTSANSFSNRDSLIEANSVIINHLQSRLKAARYRPREGDESKLGYINALVNALQVQNNIIANVELDEIKEELEKMKRC